MSYYIPRPVTPYKWGKHEGIHKQEHFNLYCLDSTQFFCKFKCTYKRLGGNKDLLSVFF